MTFRQSNFSSLRLDISFGQISLELSFHSVWGLECQMEGSLNRFIYLMHPSVSQPLSNVWKKEAELGLWMPACFFFFIHVDHQPAFAWTSLVSQSGLDEPSASSFSTHWLDLLKLFDLLKMLAGRGLARWMSDVVGVSLSGRGEKVNRGQYYDL